MRIDIRGVQAFLAIAELGSFARAAQALELTQTALSRRIAKLEDYVGQRLVERSTATTGLTAAGESFLPHARRTVEGIATALGWARLQGEAQRGRLRLACATGVDGARLAACLRGAGRSAASRGVALCEGDAAAVAAMVLRSEAELGLLHGDALPAGLQAWPLREDPVALLCPPAHPLAAQPAPLRWSALARAAIVLPQRDLPPPARALALCSTGPVHEVADTAAALAWAAAGIAPALAVWDEASAAPAGLRALPLAEPAFRVPLVLVQRAGVPLSLPARRLRGALAAAFESAAVRAARLAAEAALA